jgi:hypothetical protein
MTDETRGRPIFILGPPRSGTTLLGLMLHAHPRVAIPFEKNLVVPAYFQRGSFGDLSQPESRRLLAESIVSTKGFDELGLASEWIKERVVATGWTVGAAVGLVLRAHADRFGKVRWGDKLPGYRRYIWVIERLFPNAQFVSTLRDGRDCVASMATHPVWKNQSDPSCRIKEWMEAVDYADAARERLSPDSFYEVRYEGLVTEPEKHLRGLCDFLGEEFDDAMLVPRAVSDQIVSEHKVWHAKTRQEVSGSSIGGFAERLAPDELRACETIMGDRLREYGYELRGAPPASEDQLEAYARFDAERQRKLQRQTKRDRELDYPWPVADMAVSEAQLHRTLADLKERATDGQGRTMADLQRQVAVLERTMATVIGQRDAARAQLDRVLGSRTWRWTQPLRAACRMVGRPRISRPEGEAIIPR